MLFTAVSVALRVYFWLIFARVLLSWIRHNPYQPIIKFIYEITEPYLRLFRKIIPPMGPLDLSPMVALFSLYLVEWVLIQALGYLLILIP